MTTNNSRPTPSPVEVCVKCGSAQDDPIHTYSILNPDAHEFTPPAPELKPYMHEDELPADIPKADYDQWYAQSWIPDGVGCRVGPIYPPAPEQKPTWTEERRARMSASRLSERDQYAAVPAPAAQEDNVKPEPDRIYATLAAEGFEKFKRQQAAAQPASPPERIWLGNDPLDCTFRNWFNKPMREGDIEYVRARPAGEQPRPLEGSLWPDDIGLCPHCRLTLSNKDHGFNRATNEVLCATYCTFPGTAAPPHDWAASPVVDHRERAREIVEDIGTLKDGIPLKALRLN